MTGGKFKMNTKNSLFKRLFRFAGNYKFFTIAGMILSGISAIVGLLPFIFIWNGVSDIFLSYPNLEVSNNIMYNAWFTVISALGAMLIYFLALMCTHIAAFHIAKNMRFEAMSHLMSLPLGYFNETGSGKLRRIINDSASATETFLAHQLPDLVGALLTPIGVVGLLFIFDWRLGLISMIPTILGFLSMNLMTGKGKAEKLKQYQNSLERMNNEAVEYIRGIPVVKTFNQSIFSFEKFHQTILSYKNYVLNYTFELRRPMTLFQTFINSTPIFLVLSGIFFINGSSNMKIFLLNFLFYLFFTPICSTMMSKIMWTSENTMIAEDALNRVEELLSQKPLIKTNNSKIPTKFDIELKNVSFMYPNTNNNAINDISINIKQGSTVALVGPSGGGKSTLATLIARFWDANEGSVKIGGIDVRDIDENILMKNISFVFQNTNLYKASILENIKEGKPNASMEEVMRAVKAAKCEDIIEKFPKGLNTIVGTKGVYLSGGEAQRIALARAILKDAPIILLDEATAFTDPENEHQIQLAFEELTKGKTVLMIAHRLSTIQNSDCIYVIDDGEIVEYGSHKNLISKDGIYSEMWDEYQSAFTWKESEVSA